VPWGATDAPVWRGKPPEPLQPPLTRYFVDYSIDPHQLVLKDLPGGKQQAELEVTQAVYDAEGKRLNFSDAGLEVTLTAAQMARDLQSGCGCGRRSTCRPGGCGCSWACGMQPAGGLEPRSSG